MQSVRTSASQANYQMQPSLVPEGSGSMRPAGGYMDISGQQQPQQVFGGPLSRSVSGQGQVCCGLPHAIALLSSISNCAMIGLSAGLLLVPGGSTSHTIVKRKSRMCQVYYLKSMP
jgi:hypothetical protein